MTLRESHIAWASYERHAVTEVHVIVPEGIDDPARPSGGNTYDRRVCRGLAALGWAVHEHAVPGAWPRPGAAGHAALARTVRRIPDGAVVLLDGLIASAAPEALVPQARRLRQVVLVHMPLGHRPPDDDRSRARASARSSRRPRPSSRPAPGRGAGCAELYALPADAGARGRARRRRRRPGARDRGRRRAALRRGGDARQGPRRAARRARDGGGPVVALRLRGQPGPGPRRSPTACAAARATAGWATACASRGRAPAPSSTAPTPPPTCSCSPRTPRRTAWSSPRRWPAACRSSPPTSAACPRRSGTGTTARGPGLLVPPGDPAALGAALRAWLGDAALRGRLRRAARRAARVAARLARHRRPSSPASSRERRDDRGRPSGSARSGSSCASPPTRRRARPSSPSASRGTSPRPARS